MEEEEDQYQSPQVDLSKVYLAEHFDDESSFKKKWVKSEAKKQGVDENIAKYDGKWEVSLYKHSTTFLIGYTTDLSQSITYHFS